VGHYEVLGVTPNASMEEIRANYLAHVRSTHPDVQTNAEEREGAEDAMRTINAAWAVLSDVNERSVYDRERMRRARPPATGPTFAAPPVTEEVFRPFDDSDGPSFDERDDRPITPARLPGWLVMAPSALLLSGFGSMVFGSMVGIGTFVDFGLFAMLAAGTLFLMAPLVALGASRRSDRHP
jgi:curved DNA-binding protein CbpA